MTRRLLAVPALIAAGLVMSACGSQTVPSAGHPVSNHATSTAAASAPKIQEQASVPTDGPGYEDALETFGGAEKVQAATDVAIQVIGLSMANCPRWTTPGADPMTGLDTLLTPTVYDDVKATV